MQLFFKSICLTILMSFFMVVNAWAAKVTVVTP
ncbi:uncharacterized protein METZ01_LOCUS237198, partial [marine metagenome]